MRVLYLSRYDNLVAEPGAQSGKYLLDDGVVTQWFGAKEVDLAMCGRCAGALADASPPRRLGYGVTRYAGAGAMTVVASRGWE